MKILHNVACLWVDIIHTRAHLIRMIQKGVKPSYVIMLIQSKGLKKWAKLFMPNLIDKYRKYRNRIRREDIEYSILKFGKDIFQESLFKILSSESIPFDIICAKDVNDEQVINKISSCDQNYFIVNAPGILKKPLFQLKKRYINAHKGILPDFRGSSATNWAILNKGKYGATIHFMDEGIDTGPIIESREYRVPSISTVNQIIIYEASMVSDLLSDVMVKYSKTNRLKSIIQEKSLGETFYIIHPKLNKITISVQTGDKCSVESELRKDYFLKLQDKYDKCILDIKRGKSLKSVEFEFLSKIFPGIKEYITNNTINKIYTDFFLNKTTISERLDLSFLENYLQNLPLFSVQYPNDCDIEKILSFFFIFSKVFFHQSYNAPFFKKRDTSFSSSDLLNIIRIEKNINKKILLSFFCLNSDNYDYFLKSCEKILRNLQRRFDILWNKLSHNVRKTAYLDKSKFMSLTPTLFSIARLDFLLFYSKTSNYSFINTSLKIKDVISSQTREEKLDILDIILFFMVEKKEDEYLEELYKKFA